MNIIQVFFGDYFFLRQRIPFLIYFLYLRYGESESQKIRRVIGTLSTFTVLLSLWTLSSFMAKIPFSELVSFDWTYYGLIHWCVFFFIFYRLAIRKGMNSLKSFTLAILATVGGGWLYEVPYEYMGSMFISRTALFYVNGQIIYLLLLRYELMRMSFKTNRWIWATLILYLAFSLSLFLDRGALWRMAQGLWGAIEKPIWVYRVPASLFLLSLLSGIDKQSEMVESE